MHRSACHSPAMYAHRRIIAFIHQLTRIVIHIHLHLPDVLMSQVPGLQIYEHKTLGNVVVEDEINIKVPAIQIKVFLPRNK